MAKRKPETSIDKLIASVLKRRKNFDVAKVAGPITTDAYKPVARYGVAAHAKSATRVAETTTNSVQSLVDYDRLKGPIFNSRDKSMRSVWDLFLQAFLDGYAVAQALTDAPKQKPKLIGSTGAITQFVNTAMERAGVALTGSLAAVFDALLGKAFALYGEGLRKATAAAFVVGAKLRCYEYGAKHALLEELFDGPTRPRGAAIPKGKAPDNVDLVAEILATPDDDAPRLVYGDYLSTHGDARGEFIQLQCALGNIIRKAGSISSEPSKRVEDAAAMTKRAETLLKQSKGTWLKGIDLSNAIWARGFPVEGSCDASEFIANAAYDRVPLEGIGLIHWNAKLADAIYKRARHPTIRRFWFGSGFGPKLVHLIGAPVFAEAQVFDVGFWDDLPIQAKALEVVSRAAFPRLDKFEGPVELFAALDRAACPKLRTFRLSAWNLEPIRATRLWRQLHRVEVFRLEGDVSFAGLEDASSLRVLEVVAAELGKQHVSELVAAAPKSLVRLEGAFTELDRGLVAVLAKRFELAPLT